jgi:hypothetical protein
MEPITILVTALALGAAAGLKPTVAQAVQDAYAGLKLLIQRKYSGVDVAQLEKDPASQTRQNLLAEELAKARVASDVAVLQQAKQLLEAVYTLAPMVPGAIGVELEDVRGGALKISNVIATGGGVSVKGADFSGDINIDNVQAGGGPAPSPK